jgi:hypothetical protein
VDENAVVTLESQFITLYEAIGTTGAITRIYCRRRNTKRGKTLKDAERKVIMPKLIDASGEWYGDRWAASSETCNRLNYECIFVHIEQVEE